jgi:hypothetical protein
MSGLELMHARSNSYCGLRIYTVNKTERVRDASRRAEKIGLSVLKLNCAVCFHTWTHTFVLHMRSERGRPAGYREEDINVLIWKRQSSMHSCNFITVGPIGYRSVGNWTQSNSRSTLCLTLPNYNDVDVWNIILRTRTASLSLMKFS